MDESELSPVAENIGEWSVHFLKEYSNYPENGEYTAGHLVNRYIFHTMIRQEHSFADAVEYDMKMSRNTRNHYSEDWKAERVSDQKVDAVWASKSQKRKIQRALAVSLENDPNILYDGDRRGRLYRYKGTRPSIRIRDVAAFISWLLREEEKEFSIRKMGEEVCEWVTAFHNKMENDDLENQYSQFLEKPFSFYDPNVRLRYQREYDTNLLEWCENVYTNRWFNQSVPNILRYLRKEFDCISEGSKRGLWIHKDHLQLTYRTNIERDLSEIKELGDHFSRLHKRVYSFKEPKGVSIMLKQLEAQIELMQYQLQKERLDWELESKNRSPPWDERIELLEKQGKEEKMLFKVALTEARLAQKQFDISSSKITRIRDKIKRFLGEQPRNTAEILEHINSTMRHGATAQQLDNVLSKDKDIVKVWTFDGILAGSYDRGKWATRNWVLSNCPGWQEGTPIIIDAEGNVTTRPSTD